MLVLPSLEFDRLTLSAPDWRAPKWATFVTTTPLQALLNLAGSVGCLRLGQRLGQVSDVIENPGPRSPILRLICAADSIQTLADWSQDERQIRLWSRNHLQNDVSKISGYFAPPDRRALIRAIALTWFLSTATAFS